MKISVLMENTALNPEFACEHGLSLHIQTRAGRILFDTGKSANFLKNAHLMEINLALVDLAILSHGHFDHGGGLMSFLEVNRKAPVYIHEKAFGEHFSRREQNGTGIFPISIDPMIKLNPRVNLLKGDFSVGKGLLLFSSVPGHKYEAHSNQNLLRREGGELVPDSFAHEQNLIISQGGKNILISGCSHRGIINIIEQAIRLAGAPMDAVIGGFHLSMPSRGTTEPDETIEAIAKALRAWPTRYYTCHCTGLEAYEKLRILMGDQISYIQAGAELTF
ncbi:MAG TPA: MBL fold metallo-hydrolase [Verrucomicrobiota bacterium]|jgi:7,8-dihydropterin-6-yl-methyl-4-(beta-D-ribofuranosyl)aminobenzene 5'-phosphate synthase|nr:MBL fold metallo-hydrolase [Verrucomicrobiota bacterium]